MKSGISNWLLVIGVIVGALAAAGSKKAYRWVELDPSVDLSGEVLYETVEFQRVEGEKPLLIAEGGAALDATVVTRLTNSNFERIRVRHPARDAETVPIAEAEGRVLAHAVTVEGETDELRQGRIVTADLVLRAQEAGVESIRVKRGAEDDSQARALLTAEPPLPAREGDPRDERYWGRDPKSKNYVPLSGPDANLKDLVLAETIELPRRLKQNSFLDAERLALLQRQGLEQVDVSVHVPFDWNGWTQRWYFLASIGIIGAAIALKRGSRDEAVSSDGGTPAAALHGALEELVRESARLAETASKLDAEALHAAIDPIHSGALYRLVEGKDSAQASLGLIGYAHVYGPLATGERMLNRAWSAAVDGYVEEARECAERAAPHFAEALSAWPKS
ncbi:MAG: hypothetical protein H6831_05395 [Planctomycetes bacterium]|nr:hypothetical protein [Planctomycetota bacterium]MCB9903823.1 hypothetical protein [Planctomycetota bacterium]